MNDRQDEQGPEPAWPLVTDQERCYDAQGTIVPCSASGQDAAGRGHGTTRRFLPDNDAVTDAATGLRWCRDANPFGFPYTWREALDLVAGMNHTAAHGYRDWRLPARRELFSLVSHQSINPALPRDHPFANVFPGYYWTATTCARLPDQAWYVHMGGGRVYRGMKEGAGLVWPVAGPITDTAAAGARFRREGPIVHDRQTGRYWARSAHAGASRMTWEEALGAAAALNHVRFGGLSNWRLPNIRELESLVDLTRHSPALPEGHPFRDLPEGCWSSTTSVYEPRYAWVLYMRDGAVGVGFKPEPTFGAWAVAPPPGVPQATAA